ncbi:MAG: hypothetical protein JWO94_2402, partial [Verrucomicrobiaceae bacterium]|nr:hypothetical protein [Verrucomicrobiaceae bacterium]
HVDDYSQPERFYEPSGTLWFASLALNGAGILLFIFAFILRRHRQPVACYEGTDIPYQS